MTLMTLMTVFNLTGKWVGLYVLLYFPDIRLFILQENAKKMLYLKTKLTRLSKLTSKWFVLLFICLEKCQSIFNNLITEAEAEAEAEAKAEAEAEADNNVMKNLRVKTSEDTQVSTDKSADDVSFDDV
jgi:hypothetical protein